MNKSSPNTSFLLIINSIFILQPLLPHLPYLYLLSDIGQWFASRFRALQKCYLKVSNLYLINISLEHITNSKFSNLQKYLFSGFFQRNTLSDTNGWNKSHELKQCPETFYDLIIFPGFIHSLSYKNFHHATLGRNHQAIHWCAR